MIDFRGSDKIAIIGDSNTAGSNGPPWQGPMIAATRAAFTRAATEARIATSNLSAPATSVDLGCPIFYNLGAPSQTTYDLVSRLPEIYALQPTGVIAAYQINDCDPGNPTPNATFESNITTATSGLFNPANYALGVPPRWVAMVECVCWGEKVWGANPNDTTATGLAAKDAIYRARAPIDGFDLIQTRLSAAGNGPWNDTENIINPSRLASGFLTSDQRHVTAAGASFLSSLFLQSVTMVIPS